MPERSALRRTVIDVGDLPGAFPGWTRIEAELKACAAAGDDAKLSAVEVMIVLGEVGRQQDRAAVAARILRVVAAGDGCWGVEHGYATCQFQGVDGFLAGQPVRRRWWRR